MALEVALVTQDARVRQEMARFFDDAPLEWRVTLHPSAPLGADVVVAGPDATVSGALSYEPSSDLLERISIAVRSQSRTSVVVGGLPGSGRTSVAIHLAAFYAGASSVCLVDRHPERGCALRLGISDPLVYRDGDDIRRAAIPVLGGFRLLTAEDEPDNAILAGFDRIVFDEPGLQRADVAVIQPTRPQAQRLATVVADAPPNVVITNRMGRGGETTRRDLERVLSRRIALELPHAPALRDAEDDGILVPRWTRWWGGVARLARALQE